MLISCITTVGKTAPEHSEYQAYAVTPSDSVDLPAAPDGGSCRGFYVGGAGNVSVNLIGGGTALFSTLAAGQYVVAGITRILATSTTATLIQALY